MTHSFRALAVAGAALSVIAGCAGPGTIGAPADEPAHTALANVVSNDGFVDKVLAGYQGWFAADGDGAPIGWSHWSPTRPAPGNVTVEIYPDTREYDAQDLFATDLGPLGNGQPSKLFSSFSPRVVDTQFAWMEQAGIDGVGLQRFVSELGDGRFRAFRNQIADNVRAAAEQHGRVFYLAYDISGAHEGSLEADIEHDWADVLEGQLALSSSPRYARQDGRPVVLLWGFGVADRPGTPGQALALAQWFKARGCYVVAGVGYGWRSESNVKPGFLPVWPAYDMVQPWAVGSAATDADVDGQFASIVPLDKQWASSHGLAYQRVIFPGFAWSNWNGGAHNMIPRRAGKFFWRQAYDARSAAVSTFIAMFDEYDEGTAIAKAAEDASMRPASQYFLTLDADGTHVSSDYYLRLAGAATRMIRGDAPHQTDIPIPLIVGPAPAPSPQPGPDPGPGPSPGPAPNGDPVPPQDAFSPKVQTFSAAQAEVIVARLYRALLGREADPGGMGAYRPAVMNGSLAGVVSALVTSSEFEARRPSLTTQSFAQDLYHQLLDRDADPSGLGETANQIHDHHAAARAVGIVLSPEYQSKN